MKKFLFIAITFLSISFDLFPQNPWLLFYDDEDELLPIVKNYKNRIIKDNGTITDITNFNKQLREIKNQNYLDSLLFWVSSIGGIKKSKDTVKVLYDLRGNDLVTSNGFPGPLYSTESKTQKKVIYFPAIRSLQNSTIYNPPFTMLLVINQDETTEDEAILNSLENYNYSIFTDKKSNLVVQGGKKIKNGNIDQQKLILLIEFNSDSSRIFVNNVLVETGKLDLVSLSGILLGRNNKSNPDFYTGYFYTCGIFKSVLSDQFRLTLFNLLK